MRHVHIHVHDARWEESKHPRKDNGKFGSSAVLGRSSGRPSGKPYEAASLERAKRALRVIPPGPGIAVERIFSHPEADPMEVFGAEEHSRKSKESSEVVSLKDLIPTQEHVTRKGVLGYLSNQGPDDAKPIAVMAMDDKLYLLDGHHRVAAMMLAGINKAPLVVMRKAR